MKDVMWKDTTLLRLLLLADGVFIALHILLHTELLNHPMLSLERDRGYPELFQYLKLAWIVILLLAIYLSSRAKGYFIWAALFTCLLLDDAMLIHENAGRFIGAALDLPSLFGLRPADLGELAVSAIIGGALLISLAWVYPRDTAESRHATRRLLLLLIALAVCGIVFDMLHAWLYLVADHDSLLLAVMEDGGEMLVISVMVWYVFRLNARAGNLNRSVGGW